MALLDVTRHARALIGAILLASAPVRAQDPAAPRPEARLSFGDLEEIRGWYKEYDRILDSIETAGHWGALRNNLTEQANFRGARAELRELFDLIAKRRVSRDVTRPMLAQLRALFTSVSTELFEPATAPAQLNVLENRISALLSQRLSAQLDEYYRRFFIKYGGTSERLNWIEILLTEATFTHVARGSEVSLPNPWEWIVRAQAMGYQYSFLTRRAQPSSPVGQLGLSYYLFGTTRLERWLNHIGLAGAYERDLFTDANLYGGVLHLNRLDILWLCHTSGCSKPVVGFSTNVQFIDRWF